jgi:GR25 family glycosyltransferase involved in LPS biosynthesis
MKTYILGIKDNFRGNSIKDELESRGMEVEVVHGIDGQLMTESQIERVYSKSKAKVVSKRELSRGEIACRLGHSEIYARIASESQNWSLVLEDDTKILNFEVLTTLELKDVKKPMIVQLQGLTGLQNNSLAIKGEKVTGYGCLVMKVDNLSVKPNVDFPVLCFKGLSEGTYGYLINKSAATVALNSGNKIDSTADWPYRWRDEILFAVSAERICEATLSNSNIAFDRDKLSAQITHDFGSSISRNSLILRIKGLIGIFGLQSIVAFFRGESLRQHYKENILYPFLVRRLNRD